MAMQLVEDDCVTEKRIRDFARTLSEKDFRRFAAIEAAQRGYGAIVYIADVLGCSTKTIERGLKELDQLQDDPAAGRVRRPGAGRKKKDRIGVERRRKSDLLPGSTNGGRSGRRRDRVHRSVASNLGRASR